MKAEGFDAGFPTEIVREGKVKIVVPKLKAFVTSPSEYAPSKAPVFYNPVMELNRDVAVLALQAYQRTLSREISVCEPLAGCGVRGVRFALEVEGVEKLVVNDLNVRAFQLAKHNVRISGLDKRVIVENEDANFLLSSYGAPRRRFDVIDLDPFGSPVPYIDSAVRALRSGGLLALTATDMAPLCGIHPKACVRKYGGKPLRTEYCHELAVRILAGCLAMTAAKHDIGVSIVFSHSTDHYIRVYATIKYGAKKANENIRNMGHICHCFRCLHRKQIKGFLLTSGSGKCDECGSKISVAGPLWLGKISDEHFCELMEKECIQSAFKHRGKILKILGRIKDEVEAPVTYYVLDKLCGMLALPVPSIRKVVEALRKQGFQASLTDFNPKGIRSNASAIDMKELLRKIQASSS